MASLCVIKRRRNKKLKNKIELLAPAGDLEKLKIAVLYGADAVYIGGEELSLRAKAKNFTFEEMGEGVKFAHDRGKKVYVACNVFAHNYDFKNMEEYFKKLNDINVDAVIVSDAGVFSVAKEIIPNIDIHISTQANNTNYKSALFWHKLGAKRIVTARELSINEISDISENIPKEIEIESFVHGAMCISYSGRCLLSNYMSARDANKGECSHPCRWKYALVESKRPGEYMPIEEDNRGTYIFNSKDLCMIEHIPDLVNAGVMSFKIEGRMKTSYYVGTVVKAYREAIDDYFKDILLYESKKKYYVDELKKASYRGFTTGFYYGKPGADEQIYTSSSYIRNYDFIGMVKEYDETEKTALIEQRNKFIKGCNAEILRQKGNNFMQKIEFIKDENGNEINEAPHAQQLVTIKVNESVKPFDMLRIRIK